MDVKAIETTYKGYHFRSRLEARWAVYFDAIGMMWEYEKEGFELDNGLRYLPDFWLPETRFWAEVKPEEFSDEDIDKCKQLAMHTDRGVILLVGVPDVASYGLIVPYWKEDIVMTFHRRFGRGKKHNLHYCSMGIHPVDVSDEFFPEVKQAVDAARSARFEFGENGARPTHPDV